MGVDEGARTLCAFVPFVKRRNGYDVRVSAYRSLPHGGVVLAVLSVSGRYCIPGSDGRVYVTWPNARKKIRVCAKRKVSVRAPKS